MKNLLFLLMLLIWNSAQSQDFDANLAWLTGVQDQGASAFITKSDNLGGTHVLGIYKGCPTCFMRMEGSSIIEMGNNQDYLFLMKIDEDGVAGQPLLVPSNGRIRIADFDINLNNELVIFLMSDNNFFFNTTEIEEGYSILNLNASYEPNWIKHIEGASFARSGLSSSSSIYSSSDQLSINGNNEIIFIGAIPSINTDVVLDTISNGQDTFYIYETEIDTLIIDGEEFSANGSNFFLTSLDHDGNHNWTKVYEHDFIVNATGLSLSKEDKIGVCGYFGETDFIMDNDTLGGVDTSAFNLAYCSFASTFDEDGNQLIAKRMHQNAIPKFLTFDNNGALLITSEFQKTAFLNNDTIASITPASDQLLTKLDLNGNIVWRKRQGNSNSNQILRVRYTSNDEIVSSGELIWPKFLYSFSESGTMQESLGPNVTTNVHGLDIDFTSNGTLIATGTHFGEFNLGPYTLPHQAGNNWGQYIAGFSDITSPSTINTFLGEINARIDPSLCYGNTGSIHISSSIGMDWKKIEWSNGGTTSSITSVDPGNISVIVTDIYDNTSTATFFIPTSVSTEIPYNGLDDDCDPQTLDDDLDQDGFALADDCDDTNPNINANQAENPYNGIDDDCNPLTLDDDLDQDGFVLADDCDDTNPNINANQAEVPYNGIDDDCDPLTLDDDLDQDGFALADDCDDTNPNINASQAEVPYNGIDDDCDPQTLDDDLDQDGFALADDCDDTNPNINASQAEVPYNGIDDDCDPLTLDDDLDQDGFALADDCDDTNPNINANQAEVPYNGIDDDCDPLTLDDDLDQDGFALADDCDDTNPNINANQAEVPYNGIDEDCDPLTLDDDLDQDGFVLADDCDDTNPNINASQAEVPYNGIDDDCDPQTLDDDLDQDGFALADDCDDTNPNINANQTEVPYNGIDDDCDPLTLDDDLDQDGFALADDCDDTNPNINANQVEVPYNGIDEDCDPLTLDDDLDQDGFALADDCDDTNPNINANQAEVPYNDIDDDCDPLTLDDDLDQDGFALADDCDDTNPNINANQAEVPYNGIDDDCDPLTLDDDLDQDGFALADDCDDTNPNINANQAEVPYNDIDDDCDPLTLDDDLDQDGFALADDCDDTNPNINPDAQEIPNNGIDEDCDQVDLVTANYEIENSIIKIFPNPVSNHLSIQGVEHMDTKLEIYDLTGNLIFSTFNTNSISVVEIPNGLYLLKLISLKSDQFVVERIVVAK